MVDIRSVEEVSVENFIVAVGETDTGTYEASVVKNGNRSINTDVVGAVDKFTAVGRAIDDYLSDEE